MRIASLRGPLIALIFLGSVAMARPQQPEREVLGKEWTRRASQYSGGLQVQPAPVSGGLQVQPAPVSGGLQVQPAPVSGALQVQPAPVSGGLQVQPAPVSGALHASLEAFSVKVQPAPASATASQAIPPQPPHHFWDRTNDLWFAAVGAGRGLDYASTLNLRRRGIDEIFLTNSIVDNHPLFAGIEAAGTAASIGLSYLFHRTGHHQLERWTSIVHFGVATGGAARNYALKTPHNP